LTVSQQRFRRAGIWTEDGRREQARVHRRSAESRSSGAHWSPGRVQQGSNAIWHQHGQTTLRARLKHCFDYTKMQTEVILCRTKLLCSTLELELEFCTDNLFAQLTRQSAAVAWRIQRGVITSWHPPVWELS